MRLAVVVSVLLFATILTFVPSTTSEAAVSVDVGNFFFDPDPVTITAGESVEWVWVNGFHSIETADGGEQWCAAQSGGTCEKVFDTPGTYAYRCGVHPGSMTGTVTVEQSTPTVTFTSPGPGSSVSGATLIEGTATWDVHELTGAQLRVDDGPWSNVDDLTGGGTSTLTFSHTVQTTDHTNGLHTVEVRARGADGSQGRNSLELVFDNPAFFDVSVQDFDAANGILFSTTLELTIANQGNTVVEDGTLLFEYLYQGDWIEIDTLGFTVQPQDTLGISYEWESLTHVGEFIVRATLDPDDEIAETNEGNNQATADAGFWTDDIEGIDLANPI